PLPDALPIFAGTGVDPPPTSHSRGPDLYRPLGHHYDVPVTQVLVPLRPDLRSSCHAVEVFGAHEDPPRDPLPKTLLEHLTGVDDTGAHHLLAELAGGAGDEGFDVRIQHAVPQTG